MPLSTPVIYFTSGEMQPKHPDNGRYFTLEELQAIVGGYIEMVELADERVMIVNENGKLDNLPHNAEATRLFNMGGRIFFDPIAGDVIVGDALWFDDWDGDDDEPDGDTYFDV